MTREKTYPQIHYSHDSDGDVVRRIQLNADEDIYHWLGCDETWVSMGGGLNDHQLEGVRHTMRWSVRKPRAKGAVRCEVLNVGSMSYPMKFYLDNIVVGCQEISRRDAKKIFKKMGDWLGYDVD